MSDGFEIFCLKISEDSPCDRQLVAASSQSNKTDCNLSLILVYGLSLQFL